MSDILPTPLTSSQRWLLALLSPQPARRPGNQEEVRWDEFLRLAGGLGLGPFLAHVLQEDSQGLPDSAREQLIASGRANAMRQLRRHAALGTIAASLEQARIPLMVLKGMALAYLAYPNPYCRPMSDIDLFVPRADLGRAVQAMRDSGFADSRLSFRQECPAFTSPDRRLYIEMHGSIPSMEQFGIDSDSLWERSLSVSLGGVQVRVLRPEDFVQHLCLHIGPHHNYLSRLRELLDFRFYLEKHGAPLDWQAFAERSLQIGSSAWVYLTLWLAQELLGAPVSADFFQSCPAPRSLGDLSRLATQHLLSVPALPMSSSLVEVCASGSFQKRWDSLREHWRTVGSRGKDPGSPREAESLGTGDYLGLLLRRVAGLIRAGALRPSAWRAAAKYQVSRAHLLNLMDGEARVLPPHPPAA